MWTAILREPVAIATAIRSLVLLAVAFGLAWSPEQIAALMICIEAVLAIATRALVTPITPRNGSGLGSVKIPIVLLVGALSLGAASGCAAHAPPADVVVVKTDQAVKVADVIRRVGLALEQVQLVEIQLHAAGEVTASTHRAIQSAFAKTSTAVIVMLETLQDTAKATGRQAALQAVITGLDDLAQAVTGMNPALQQRLSILIGAARLLVEASTALL